MRITTRAEIIVTVAAASWGVFWLPLRAFEQYGLSPAWITFCQFVVAFIAILPIAFIRRSRQQPLGFAHYDSGLLVGAGFVLYCGSLLLTEVARTLILFYTMPVWGAIFEITIMGRRFTRWRGLALLLGMAGLLIMLSGQGTWTIKFNVGDAMALVASLFFTLGVMRVRQSPQISVFEQLFAFFFYGGIVALALTLLPIADFGVPPNIDALRDMIFWLALMSLGFLLPTMAGVYWGSRWVDPGRLGVLLQIEVVVGLVSAALLANEPFGMRETLGGVLVISAGLVEILGNRPNQTEIANP